MGGWGDRGGDVTGPHITDGQVHCLLAANWTKAGLDSFCRVHPESPHPHLNRMCNLQDKVFVFNYNRKGKRGVLKLLLEEERCH